MAIRNNSSPVWDRELTMTMTLIQTTTLGTAAAAITLGSIPQSYTDLNFVFSLRSTTAVDFFVISFNGSGASITARFLDGSGTVAASSTRTGDVGDVSVPSDATANTFSNGSIYIPNYTSSANKTWSVDSVTENNASAARQIIMAGLWSDTGAITSITLTGGSGTNFAIGSTISLYGILKGSDGIVTVS